MKKINKLFQLSLGDDHEELMKMIIPKEYWNSHSNIPDYVAYKKIDKDTYFIVLPSYYNTKCVAYLIQRSILKFKNIIPYPHLEVIKSWSDIFRSSYDRFHLGFLDRIYTEYEAEIDMRLAIKNNFK